MESKNILKIVDDPGIVYGNIYAANPEKKDQQQEADYRFYPHAGKPLAADNNSIFNAKA